MFGAVRDGISSTVPAIRSAVVNGLEGAWSYIKGIPSAAVQWGGDIVRGLMNGIRSMIGSVGSMASNLANTIKDKIRGALGISSPSKVMMEVGKYTGQGLALGMEGQIDEVSSMARKMANGITGINGSMPDIRSANSINGGASVTNITNSLSPQIHVSPTCSEGRSRHPKGIPATIQTTTRKNAQLGGGTHKWQMDLR